MFACLPVGRSEGFCYPQDFNRDIFFKPCYNYPVENYFLIY